MGEDISKYPCFKDEFTSTLKIFETEINSKINLFLISKSNGLERKQTCRVFERYDKYAKEKLKLKDENQTLQERNNNLCYIKFDFNTRDKDVENEKESLKTAIKLF